jgi:hypothetical protein
VSQVGAEGQAGAEGQVGAEVTATIVSPARPGADLVAEVRPQVERILALDVDGSGFPAVGERDPVVGELQRRYPGDAAAADPAGVRDRRDHRQAGPRSEGLSWD